MLLKILKLFLNGGLVDPNFIYKFPDSYTWMLYQEIQNLSGILTSKLDEFSIKPPHILGRFIDEGKVIFNFLLHRLIDVIEERCNLTN